MLSIYTLCDPRTGEVRYVGMSRNPHRRLKQYQAKNGGHTPHLRNWLASVSRNPTQIVLEEAPDAVADQREREWIALLRSYGARLVNYTDGGESGFKYDPEVLARVSAAQRRFVAQGTHNFLRPEVRAKVIAAARANHAPRPWSAAQARKLSAAQRGVPLTEEHKRKCSEALRGKVRSPEVRQRDSIAARRRWEDPEYAARTRAATKLRKLDNSKAVAASAEKRRGMPLTPEHRRKVSDGQKATWTPERRAAMSAARKGKVAHPMTAEMKAKVSASLRAWYAAHPNKAPGGRTVHRPSVDTP